MRTETGRAARAARQLVVYEANHDLREVMALARAWLDLELLKPEPVLGDPIPVDWSQRSHQVP